MLMEGNDERANGWPLGLGNINSRFRVADTSQEAPPPQPNNTPLRSSSFSSFSSSNLDTESTASFFPDQSVSLGRLIGIRPMKKGNLYYEVHRKVPDERSHLVEPKGQNDDVQGLCASLLYNVIRKKARSGSSRRH